MKKRARKNINHQFARGSEFVLDKGTKVFKDRKKYTRKEKHKDGND